MKNRVRAAVVVAMVAASVGVAPAAFAASNDNVCDNLEVCAFKDVNYAGGLADMPLNNASFLNDDFSSGGSAHDAVSSGFNAGRVVEYWADINYAGPYFILASNQYDSFWSTNQPNASSASYNFNDKVDSSTIYIP